MIEVIDVKDAPDITEELALASMRVISDFCKNQKDCGKCPIVAKCHVYFTENMSPAHWEVQ